MGDFDADLARVEQIRRAHSSAKPKTDNPAWWNSHHDMTVLFGFIDNLWKAYTFEINRAAHEPACEYEQDGYRIETACGDVFHLDACEVPPDHCGKCGKVLTIKSPSPPPGERHAPKCEKVIGFDSSKECTCGQVTHNDQCEISLSGGNPSALCTCSAPPPVEQDTEALVWAQRVHEDLAKYTQEDGQMIHVRANRALGILFAEIERLEKALYPGLTKGESL